jgi:hypothetical protein
MKGHLRIVAVLSAAVVVQASLAQEAGPCQQSKEYAGPYPGLIAAPPLLVPRVFGRALIDARGKVIPGSKLGPACLSLFTADSHQFVASVRTDKRGQFQFPAVAPGRYRLVARAPGLCTGNISIEVTPSHAKRGRRGIVLYFRIAEIDSCTDADYDTKQSR